MPIHAVASKLIFMRPVFHLTGVLYRKRPLAESSKTPNIRPSKVLKGSGDSTSGTRTEDIGATDLEEAISKCFIGIIL